MFSHYGAMRQNQRRRCVSSSSPGGATVDEVAVYDRLVLSLAGVTTKGEMSAKTTYQRSAKGPVTIPECAPDGKFVVLENTGRKVS